MVIVGDGPQRARLQSTHASVQFVGMQRGDELARHYASADVFLFPSLTDTFGNVTLEALASGLAVAAFDTAAAGQHIENGSSGCLAAPGHDAAAREAFVGAAARALAAATPESALRQRAVQAARGADWPSVMARFERRLCRVADCHGLGLEHAVMA